MHKRDFLRVTDLNRGELEGLLARAATLKARHAEGVQEQTLAGRSLVMIFEKSSTRTRVSFELGMQQLGGNTVHLSAADCQIGRGEPLKDTARVLSRYGDIIMIRTFGHQNVEEMAKYSSVPVINGLTDEHHPCQILADLLTIKERRANWKELTVAWVGDGNNMAHSWIEAAGVFGMTLRLAVPEGYEPDVAIVEEGRRLGGHIVVMREPADAAEGADVIMTDVWTSMGQEGETSERNALFQPYQVNSDLLKNAADDVLVLHCLPAHRGEEITDEVMEGAHSVVFDQAENRMHAQKALLEFLLGKLEA